MIARPPRGALVALAGSCVLALAVSAGPIAVPARADTGTGAGTLEIRGLKRANQILTVLTALLKLLDDLASVGPGFDGAQPPPVPPGPPPSGTGHPGPGPLPVVAPDDPPLVEAVAPA